MSILKSFAVLACALVISACGLFDGTAVQNIAGPAPSSRVKFFNFGVNSPGVNFYANDQKMSAVSTTRCTSPVEADVEACRTTGIEATTGVAYGAAGANGMYVGVDAGQYTFSGRIAATTDKDLPISNVAATIENGRFYSFYQSGIYNATAKTIDAFIVEDALPGGPIDYSVAHVRFVNAISNGTGDLNLYATNITTSSETPVGGAVAYRAAGTFVSLPAGTYNLRAAYTGAPSNVVSRTGVSFVGGRVYTITSRGSTATASTLFLDNTINQQ